MLKTIKLAAIAALSLTTLLMARESLRAGELAKTKSPLVQEISLVGLLDYAQTGDAEGIKRLLQTGANINERNKFGATPLMVAAGQGNLAAVKALLEAGADYTVKNYFDQDVFTILQPPSIKNRKAIIKLIKQASRIKKAV